MNNTQKIIKVTCAIIENKGKILAAQRSEKMGLPLKWEFPGGKIEPGENAEDCIVREIMEELDIEVSVKNSLPEHVHNYGTKCIMLIPFICNIKDGKLKCKEHKQVIWDEPQKLSSLDWADADVPVYEEYLKYIERDL